MHLERYSIIMFNISLCIVDFKFSEVNFKDIDDVPTSLLKSVALCFREKKMVCRWCFFGERDLSEEDSGQLCSTGEHKWLKPIVVIPGMLRQMVIMHA